MLFFKKFLSPIASTLSNIVDFSDVDKSTEDLEREYIYLENVTKVVSKTIFEKIDRLKQLEVDLEKQVVTVENETGDDKKDAIKVYNSILKAIEDTVSRVNMDCEVIDEPYFGKISFDRKRDSIFPSALVKTYIGKSAYFDKETKRALITDWRAPIANLYYTNSGPAEDISFESPMGVQSGDLKEKTMFEISKARIKNIYNSKTGNSAADEFLLSQLSQRVGQKLTDIVSTIQNEQNRIIRDTINKFVVLQGVAGSGKTTIVLHRLAYLFFTYQKEISPAKTLIIAPNKLFLDYISGVLPSLGVVGVETNTYLFWGKKVVGWDNRYLLSNEEPSVEAQRQKGSKEFLFTLIDGFETYIENLLLSLPYSQADSVHSNYYKIIGGSSNIPPIEAINLAVKKALADRMFSEKRVGSFISSSQDVDEVVVSNVNKYLKTELDIMKIYKEIVKNSDLDSEIKKRTIKNVRKIKRFFYYEVEDLAPMVILHELLHGVGDRLKDYVIADEAQDLTFPQVFSLFLIAKRNNLMLAGDLAQSIKTPNNISDWVEVFDTARRIRGDSTPIEFHQLNKCYRTTIENIDYVTSKIDPLFPASYLRPEAVLRHGKEVEEIVTEGSIINDGKEIEVLLTKVQSEIDLGRNTIALITPDRASASQLFTKLKESRISQSLIEFGSEDYRSGVIIVPILDAKGLEFDSVFIIDVTSENYPFTFDSARRFYVAGTRALHTLYITYPKNNISKIIKSE